MKRSYSSPTLLAGLLLAAFALVASAVAAPKNVLVVTTTTGFRHSSIATAEKILAKLAQQSGAFTIDWVQQPPNQPNEPRKPADLKPEADETARQQHKEALAKYEEALTKSKSAKAYWDIGLKENLQKLSAENLKKYDGVIFANTTGDLPVPDPQALIDWVQQGRGFVGMHSASDTFHGFSPFVDMLGGEFLTHGAQVGVECLVVDNAHPATKDLGESYCLEREEIYLLKNYHPHKVRELLVLDKHPNKKKEQGRFPVAWCKEYGQGKIFYTSLGHREDVWESPVYQKHILGGIKWALGLEPGDAKPQTK